MCGGRFHGANFKEGGIELSVEKFGQELLDLVYGWWRHGFEVRYGPLEDLLRGQRLLF